MSCCNKASSEPCSALLVCELLRVHRIYRLLPLPIVPLPHPVPERQAVKGDGIQRREEGLFRLAAPLQPLPRQRQHLQRPAPSACPSARKDHSNEGLGEEVNALRAAQAGDWFWTVTCLSCSQDTSGTLTDTSMGVTLLVALSLTHGLLLSDSCLSTLT